MKTSLILAAVAAASTASAYQCPSNSAVNEACRSINVFPLICNNPQVNVDVCNAKQCNQVYIDNYSACQCRRSATMFYEHSANVQGLLRRCGLAELTNPFGSPDQYRPGQGTQTFQPTRTSHDAAATRIYDGTTYYGGQTADVSGTTHIVGATAVVGGTRIVSGTTTWVSSTPGIVSGTSTRWVAPATTHGDRTAAPIVEPSQTSVPVYNTDHHISGGSVAGIVLGILAATALAGLLGYCWRQKRKEHVSVYNSYAGAAAGPEVPRGPTRTVVTEKVEPVVVRAGHNPTAASTSYTTVGTSTPYTTTTTTPAVATHVSGGHPVTVQSTLPAVPSRTGVEGVTHHTRAANPNAGH
ncbi:hypothetical protein B0O80DRAFT_510119 [Mortierella sp. GBAus27b]|nr:hypothetical protein BGX31_008621 [Mortierella sp. GBA43]KAI8362127.1 hypothetical protein B0O80DRAFT_510119 [Mortierella sp. GBAus27b]